LWTTAKYFLRSIADTSEVVKKHIALNIGGTYVKDMYINMILIRQTEIERERRKLAMEMEMTNAKRNRSKMSDQ